MGDILPNLTNTPYYPGTNKTSFHNGICYGNGTLCWFSDQLCTYQTCDVYSMGQLRYIPSLGGNVLFAVIFAVLALIQLGLGIRYKTWAFTGAVIFGLVLEIVGYVGRLLLHNDVFQYNNLIIYLVCLTIAPALLSAAIYLCLARIVVVYGENMSRFKPRTYTIVFCSADFISLLLQATGGAIASTSNDSALGRTGINIMIAGLSFQVVSIFIFGTACTDFALRCYRHPQSWNTTCSALYVSKLWKTFLCGLALATVTIFVRSCYRVAELHAGFGSALANNQVMFMILEGAMITIASLCLTLLHPGIAFKSHWVQANFRVRKAKKTAEKHGMHNLGSISQDAGSDQGFHNQEHDVGAMGVKTTH